MDPSQASEGIEAAMETAGSMIVEYGLSVIGAILLFIIGRMVAGWARNKLSKSLVKAGTDASLIPFFSSMLYYVLIGVVLIAVLNLFGIETTSLIAVFGAAGLAIGLALQGTLSNFAAGVMLLIFRPVRVGDFVEVAGQAGTVKEIAIFSTILHTGDNVRIVIPNAQIYGDIVKNYSFNDTHEPN